jgi:hypothetical protein
MASAPLYRPPTRVTSISIPFKSIVDRADPDRERGLHREPEFWVSHSGKMIYADPFNVGAFRCPVKRVSIAYAGGTFHQGDITGVGQDFVYVTSTNASPGTITTRTAAQMFSDISGAIPGLDYNLRINNIGGGSDLMIKGGAGVALVGNPYIKNGTYTDFRVYFTDANDAIMTVWTSGNPYNAVGH